MDAMAQIDVSPGGGDEYVVTVDDGRGTTRHRVTASAAVVAELGGGARTEDLLIASFRYLLQREPKEAILSRFDLPEIGLHFPDYPAEIKRRLGAS